MKLFFGRYFSESISCNPYYKPYCNSYNAKILGLNSDPDGSTNFEKEKILAAYLSDMYTLRISQHELNNFNNPTIQNKDGGSEAWWANIRGDTVEMSFIMDSDDPDDENYKPPLILPRKEVAYAVEKWIEFLKKEINPEYSEIIDTEDVYKEVE